MKRVLTILIFSSQFIATGLAPLHNAFAQRSIKENVILNGTILDKETRLPLAYVSVGVINKPLGTVSDTRGHFTLSISQENLTDSLRISIVGYNTLGIAVKDFEPSIDKTIEVTERIVQLAEVTVSNSKPRTNTDEIGRHGTSKLLQVSVHNRTSVDETIGSEMGMRYKNNKKNAVLKDFNFYVSANNFNFIKFRVNIYSVKEDMPDTIIFNRQIFASVDNFKTGWTKIDLEQYDIKVNSEFIVTIQWIESRMDKKEKPVTILPVAMTPFSKNCYARVASQDKWKRIGINLSSFVTIIY